jgi:VWFA-related protein
MRFRSTFPPVLAVLLVLAISAVSLIAQSDTTPVPAESSTQDKGTSGTPLPSATQTQPAQAGEQQPTFTFRQTVRRVIVDVMVRNKDGKPVRGLKASDFSITEDKQPQQILSFDVYDLDKPSISRGPNAPPLPPNVFVNLPDAPEHGPLYVIFYDLVNTDQEDQMTSRGQILKFIRSKPAGTRFAIFVNSDAVTLAQGFTDDKDLLYAALDGKHSKAHVPKLFLYGRNYGRGDPATMVQVLTHIGNYLDGIPGRKNLIWASDKFPVDLFPRDGDPVNWQDQIRAEINVLAQAQIAVFPLSVKGPDPTGEGALTGGGPHTGMGGEAHGSLPGAPAVNNPANSPILSTMDKGGQAGAALNTEEVIASMTGGRAFYNTNDVTGALDEATTDGGNYYTLTYAPPSHYDDGKCHHIIVHEIEGTDTQGKDQLSYRSYYCRVPKVSSGNEEAGGASTISIPLQAGDVLQANMKQGAPMVHDLVFSAHVRTEGGAAMATAEQMVQLQMQADFFLTQKKNKLVKALAPMRVQKYTIDYRVFDPQFKKEQRNGRPATLEFAVAAFDNEGKMLNGVVNDAVPETSAPDGENKAGLYRVHQSLAVPVNAISVRVGVRDRLSDRMGTLEVPLPLKPEPVANAVTPQH